MHRVAAQAIKGRPRIWLPIVFVFAFLLVASIPLAAGDGDPLVAASMHVSRTEASPGDNLTFWIWVNPLQERGRNFVVTESEFEGFTVVSSSAPDSCWERIGAWLCIQDRAGPLTIEVRAVVNETPAGTDLFYRAQVEVWSGGDNEEDDDDDDDDDAARPIEVSAKVRIVAPSVVGQPNVEIRLTSGQPAIVPGTPLSYRVEVTNRGTVTANNVSVIVSMPDSIVLLSASRWPTYRHGQLSWLLDFVAVGSLDILFNATLPRATGVDQVQMAVVATYANGDGEVRVEGAPASFSVLPLPSTPLVSAPQIGIIAAILAFIARSLFLQPMGPIAEEIFLLHRSGLLLKHVSTNRTLGTDTDIVGGMIAAVRMFVEDSLNSEAGPLQEIRFGGGSITFLTGQNAALAAVNTKGSRARFAGPAIRWLREFETLNGDALSNFDGDAGQLLGVDALLRRVASGQAS